MARSVRPFGSNSSGGELGYDLPFLIGWLEDIISSEEETTNKKRAKLVEKAAERPG